MNSYESISTFIVRHFTDSKLEIVSDVENQYKIFHKDKLLIVIDSTCATYFFPNRYPSNGLKWSSFLEGSLETISELILRDLADAGFLTTNRRGRKIHKRPVRLDKTTRCPKCGALDTIKRYFFGVVGLDSFSLRLAKNRVAIGRNRKKDDQEAMCVNCDWTGSTEVFRFPKREV
jgi:transcription elongation factor Elf1